MTDLQRWLPTHDAGMAKHQHGTYVTYADHVEALRQAEQRGYEKRGWLGAMALAERYEQGQRDALAAAVQRVEALCVQHGYEPLLRHYVIAAIKGDSDESA